MRRSPRLFLVVALPALVLATGCGKPAEPVQETPAAVPITPAHMAEHFSKVREVEDAIIRGDLDAAKAPARWLADHQQVAGAAGTERPLKDMKAAAQSLATTDTIDTAANAAAGLVGACGSCHAASNVEPKLPPVAARAARSDRARLMLEHQVAIDRMYRGLIVPVGADWRAGAEALKAPAREKPAPPPGLSKRISLDLRQMDVVAVMKFLAEQGDLNIVTGKNVGGRVALASKDVTILDALDIIALSNELAYVVQNRVIHVMTEADYQRLFGSSFADQRQVERLHLQSADATNVATVLGNIKSSVGRVVADAQTRTLVLIDVPEKLEQMVAAAQSMDQAGQLQTQVFELRYAKAADVKVEVEKVLTPKLGAVRFDKRTNTLVVTDLVPQIREAQQVIDAFDRKTREVIIESKIIQVRLDDRFQMGVDWEVLFRKLSDLNVRQVFPVIPPLSLSSRLIIGSLAKDKFRAVVELLQTVGKTNILSTPQIAVVENEEAKILVGTREAYITSSITQTTGAATTAEQVTFVDVGLQLKVTPTINREGFVTMKIKPEVSSVARLLTTASGNQIPIIETSTAETTVMVKDGVTIVIAGLMKDETFTEERKLPILGDIPILGMAFRVRENRVSKTELIFFLTPSIISGKEAVAGVGHPLEKVEGEGKEQ